MLSARVPSDRWCLSPTPLLPQLGWYPRSARHSGFVVRGQSQINTRQMEPPPLLSVPVPSRFGRSRPTSRARSLHNVAAEVWSRTPPLLNLLILSSTLSTVIFLPIVNHIDTLPSNTAPPTVLSAGRSPRPHDPVQPAHTHTHLQSQRRSEGPRTHTINDTLKSFEQPSAFPALSALVTHWPAALTVPRVSAAPTAAIPPAITEPADQRLRYSLQNMATNSSSVTSSRQRSLGRRPNPSGSRPEPSPSTSR